MSWKKACEIARTFRRRGWTSMATWRNGRPVVITVGRVQKGRP